ncbi:hypothetical protein SAMN05428975_3546 [Mucilaginibacter sp. OK268]|uniref:hypothetical protein n=1 Tax=Mucilaginibacter sp. OK268 TaxID=1881048 RepID=UPI00087E1A70|nr:hypothetical protein [Mucilaginibacter sp. OK268]SDP91303.1 hypothetical protein SAMN05428975_3546 [Mucilaginibacter sp. OK268]
MSNNNRTIYNLQRFQILQTKVNPQTSDYIPDAYAYAWYDEVYPIMHESDLSGDLSEFFKISKEQIDQITKYADSEWLDKRLYTFYEYEDYFSVRTANENNIERFTLIAVFKYVYLSGGFDDDFWKKLLEPMKHPAEAQSITSKFDKDSIYFI